MSEDLREATERLQRYRSEAARHPQHIVNVGLRLRHIDALLLAIKEIAPEFQ